MLRSSTESSQARLLWAPTDGDPFLIDTTADDATPDAAISDISLAGGQLVWLSAAASWTANVSADGVPSAATRLSGDMVSLDVAAVDGAVAWIESDRLLLGVADAAPVQLQLPPQAIDGPAAGRHMRLDSMAAGDGWLTIALRPAAGQPQRLVAFPLGSALR